MSALGQLFDLKCELETMVTEVTSSIACSSCRHPKVSFSVLSVNDVSRCTLLRGRSIPSSRLSERKKAQFALGRGAARLALERAGLENPPPVPRGIAGEPVWPKGFKGSITHCFPWSIAVAFPCANPCSIGIDLENIIRTRREDISSLICTNDELRWVRNGPCHGERVTLIFSAKEAVYKAFYRSYGRYIDFKEVALSWLPARECFLGRFLSQRGDEAVSCNWFEVQCRRYDDWVFSAVIHSGF